MKSKKISLSLFLFLGLIFFTSAQDEKTVYYHSLDYMLVKADGHKEYLALEKAWKKIHDFNVKADKISHWELCRVKSPAGSNAEYNYVTRISLKKGKQFENFMEAFPFPENIETILTPEELALVNRSTEIRTHVKNEIYTTIDGVYADGFEDAKIHIFNYFDHPKGKNQADHVKVEKEIWKPIHQARADAGQLEAWVLAEMVFPFGQSLDYHEITVDIYKDMAQFMAVDNSFKQTFEKVHPSKDMKQLMKQTRESATLVKGEIRMVLDKTDRPSLVTTIKN